jgi:hypothetical protein
MSLDLVRAVQKLVKTGLVQDIEWLPRFEKFAEDEVYVDPSDFEEKAFDRTRNVLYVYNRIEEGAAMLPGIGTPYEKTKRAEQGLMWCRAKGYHVVHNFMDDLHLNATYLPENYTTTMNKISFLDPMSMATYVDWIEKSIPASEQVIQEAGTIVLEHADKLVQRRRSWRHGWRDEPLVTRLGKQTLEAMLKSPTALISERTAKTLVAVAENPTSFYATACQS